MIGRILFIVAFSLFLKVTLPVDFALYAVLPAVVALILQHTNQKLYTAYFVLLGIAALWQLPAILAGMRLLINTVLYEAARFGLIVPLQTSAAEDATVVMLLLFVLLAVLLTDKVATLCLALSIFLPFVFASGWSVWAFSLLLLSYVLLRQLEKYGAYSRLLVGSIVLVGCLALPFQQVGLQQLGWKLESWQQAMQYGADAQTSLTNGYLQQVAPFERTATPAFQIIMETPRALYLKSFVGIRYDDAWLASDRALAEDASAIDYLQQANAFEQTQFAHAAASDGRQTISIRHDGLSRERALVPYELAAPLDGFDITNHAWQSSKLRGTESYKLSLTDVTYNRYPEVASKLYEQMPAPYEQQEAIANALSYRHYTNLDEETRVLLSNHFEKQDVQSYEEIFQAVLQHLDVLTYHEQASYRGEQFLVDLLEHEQQGYSVHYATLATLLLRYYNLPARYVEGYIVTNETINDAKAYEELTITSDHRHAWVEVYIDSLGWTPLEVTPGYAQKMPATADTSFASSGNASSAPAVTSPAITQVQEQQLPDPPAKQLTRSDASYMLYALLLLLLLLLAVWLLRRWMAKQALQRLFLRQVKRYRKKMTSDEPLYVLIQQLDTAEGYAAYALYNEVVYCSGVYTKEQLTAMKKLMRIVKKQIKEG